MRQLGIVLELLTNPEHGVIQISRQSTRSATGCCTGGYYKESVLSMMRSLPSWKS